MVPERPYLLYLLHSGNLYGTERMALVTLDGLRDGLTPLLMAPPGPVHAAARALGIESHEFASTQDLFLKLPPLLQKARQTGRIAVCATGVSHSLLFMLLNVWFRLKNAHLHLVHGGTDERLSYGRKKLLNYFPILLVAVSGYVRERLLAHGVCATQIRILENFLPDPQIANAPKRLPFQQAGIRKVLVISRIDPIKRIDVLLAALDLAPALAALEIRILGTGWELEKLTARAQRDHPNVTFVGFTDQVEQELAATDLLLHLCPTEPFGLAILEAMAAHVPILLPNAGGAASLIEAGVSGLHFQANDAADLVRQLSYLQSASAETLNNLTANAQLRLHQRYSGQARLNDYRALFKKVTI
jgi:glycosyltransferase involved in cell wall biosynthesis